MKKTLILLFSILSLASATAQDTITENDTCYMFWPHSTPFLVQYPQRYFNVTYFWENLATPGTLIYGVSLRGDYPLDSTISVSLAVRERDTIYYFLDTVYLDPSAEFRYLKYNARSWNSPQDETEYVNKCNEIYFHRPWQVPDTFYVVIRYGEDTLTNSCILTTEDNTIKPQRWGVVQQGNAPTIFSPFARGPVLYWQTSEWGREFPILEPNRTRCGKPRGLHLTGRGDTWVSLAWFSGSGDAYRVTVEGPDSTFVIITTDTAVSITNLAPQTFYNVEVRSMCRYQYYSYDSTFVNPGRASMGFRTNSVGIAETENLEQGIGIFPNPATDRVDITSDQPMTHIELTDILGREIGTYPDLHHTTLTLDLSALPRGTYLLRILTPLGPTTKKLLLQ